MKIITRHMVVGMLFSLLITIMVSGVTFLVFPPNDWELLIERSLYDLPFLLLLFVLSTVLGLIFGLITGLYWRQRLNRIAGHLDELAKGQEISDDVETYKELTKIKQLILLVQDKIREQAEYAQRLASQRATEREKSLQEVVAQERTRLARELHDSVSQQLFAASMMMSALNESELPRDETVNKQLQMVEKMIHQSQLEMRALLLHLRPVALKGKSLQEGAEELLVELIQKVPMDIDWNIESFSADKGVEDQLFRILQEAVSNTLRHAKANALHVLLIERDNLIILRIVDDGIGFEVENTKTSSYGLQNMRERAIEIGGTFKVVSLPNKGTRLEVKVPKLERR